MNLILPHIIARDAQRSLNLLFADCAADESCRRAFPGLRQELATVLQRLDKTAARTSLSDPTTGAQEQIEISRGIFVTVLRSLLQSTSTTSQIPLLIHRAFENDFGPFARLALTLRRTAADSLSYGMFLSVIGSEDIPLADPKVVARLSRDTFLGSYYARQVIQAAKFWPRGNRPRGYNRPVHSNTPVLLLSGYLDPATPPNGAAEAARHLTNSLHVVIRHGSHSYSGLSPCVDKIMASFVERAAVRSLDISCVNEIRRPPFALATPSTGQR